MPFKMKGFPMMKGTGAMKAMKESAMKKMHASPKKAMKDPMKKMKDPMKAMKDPMKAMHASPKKAMHASPKKAMSPKKKMTDSKVALNAMASPGGATKKALGKMADDKGKKVAKQTPQLGRLKSKLTIKANGKKEASEKEKLNKFLKKNSPKKAMKESPKKAMSPKKKTIAKDKDPKFKKSNRKSQAEFEPMYEGADISRAQFNKMSKREQRKYVKTQTD